MEEKQIFQDAKGSVTLGQAPPCWRTRSEITQIYSIPSFSSWHRFARAVTWQGAREAGCKEGFPCPGGAEKDEQCLAALLGSSGWVTVAKGFERSLYERGCQEEEMLEMSKVRSICFLACQLLSNWDNQIFSDLCFQGEESCATA